jgi:hypothetical protein
MEGAFRRAIANVVQHGDTDIFPFPVENRILFDKQPEILQLLSKIHQDFDRYLVTYPPANHGALAPVGYTGFRWATQIDPIWNVYFLALVIELAERIEKATCDNVLSKPGGEFFGEHGVGLNLGAPRAC